MIVTRSSDGVQKIQNPGARAAGRAVWNTGYMGTRCGDPTPDSVEAIYPDVYVVDQGPGVTLPPHFHVANEFQVVLSGSGSFGNHAVQAISLHYAGAYSPYGPILAGDDGIGYMTIRKNYDPGARTMPAAMPELRAAGRQPRDLVSDVLDVHPAAGAPECSPVFAPEPDGLSASLYRLPPNAGVTGPDPASGGGQFWIVLDGAMRSTDGATLPPRSCVFVSADERAQRIEAAPTAPLAVLVVQFPV